MSKDSPRPRGRPTIYTPEIERELLQRLEAGESLKQICSDEHMPSYPTVIRWASDNTPEGFSDRYARARMVGYQALAEDLILISDGHDKQDAIRDRLRVDTRKWILAKMLPKLYGDKLALTGPEGGLSAIRIEMVTPSGHDDNGAA